MKAVHLVSVALVLMTVSAALGTSLFTDGFEGYVGGNAPLDANLSGANQGANGGPNPWFGPAPPNLRVVGTTGGVNPHGGNQMVTASAASDFDQDWVNIAYRTNGAAPVMGNVALDWWFYDPSGAGGTNYRDYVALGNYTYAASPTATADYGADSNLNHGSALQRLSLGASNPTGYDANSYQARVVGASDGLNGGGWFNVGTRSVGWHEGRIVLGDANGASTTVSFYIDDMNTPVLTHGLMTTSGVNVIELNAGFGSTLGYFDDIALTPEPISLLALLLGLPLLSRRRSA